MGSRLCQGTEQAGREMCARRACRIWSKEGPTDTTPAAGPQDGLRAGMGVEIHPQYALWILVDFRSRRMPSRWKRECRGKHRQQQGMRSEWGAGVLSKPGPLFQVWVGTPGRGRRCGRPTRLLTHSSNMAAGPRTQS